MTTRERRHATALWIGRGLDAANGVVLVVFVVLLILVGLVAVYAGFLLLGQAAHKVLEFAWVTTFVTLDLIQEYAGPKGVGVVGAVFLLSGFVGQCVGTFAAAP